MTLTHHFADVERSQVYVEVACRSCVVIWDAERVEVEGQWSQRRYYPARPPGITISGAERVSIVHSLGGTSGSMSVTAISTTGGGR